MNKAITDGIVFTPPEFADGLDVWSSGDGTPTSDRYDNAQYAAFVPADANFAGCLELQKVNSVQKIRYTGETPLSPGCYLRITARVKLLSGAFPSVRIAGWAGKSNNSHLGGVVEYGPAVPLDTYGAVVEVSAIVGSGNKNGVDMVWGKDAAYGHFGLDFIGPNGGILRVDDFEIEDVSGAYVDQLIGAVDVRDFGAVGDGTTNDHDAFEAADDAANGREILVPEGTYFLNNSITLQNPVRFVGTLSVPDAVRITLLKSFDLPTYIDAFGDEVLAFKKAFQSLLNFNDHEGLDMGGRRIELDGPIDMQAAVNNKTAFNSRRVIRNGQIQANPNANWDTDVVTAQATYAVNDPTALTNVANIANIKVGSLVEGNGVGREIYVKQVNVGGNWLRLSKPLYDAEGTQTYTFKRFKYMLDFSAFSQMSLFTMDDIEFQCSGEASAIMLPQDGVSIHFRDCFFTRPKDRAITSIGTACQGMMIDRCQFLSDESPLKVQDRVSIGLNSNSNDIKIRENRIVHFKHFAIIGGTGSVITGNHWFHGDGEPQGVRKGGIVFTIPNVLALITGNYIDNNFIEMTNEHDPTPDFSNQFSFGGIAITGNVFLATHVAPWFKFLIIKPYGTGHSLQGISVQDNTFRTLGGNINRIEGVDTTFADLDYTKTRNVIFEGNTFNSINTPTYNPLVLNHNEQSDTQVWTVDSNDRLPFQGRARFVSGLVTQGRIRQGNTTHFDMPYVDTQQGPDNDQIKITWPGPRRGIVTVTMRVDNPG